MCRTSAVFTGISLAVGLLGVAATASPLGAQQRGSLFGSIFDQRTLEPIAGATITVADDDREIRSAEDGSFVLSDLPAGPTTIRIAVPGFSTAVERIEIAAGELSFLQFAVLPLDVTLREVLALAGVSSELSASAVSEVVADSVTAATSAADLLAQRIPGLDFSRGDGSIGSGGNIRIRGVSSLSLSTTPAIYLDGVRIDADASSNLPLRSSPSLYVLDTIPASDVKRIRILRGSSAPARFADSANGVILIETRHAGDK